jgi:hypothetical protein
VNLLDVSKQNKNTRTAGPKAVKRQFTLPTGVEEPHR